MLESNLRREEEHLTLQDKDRTTLPGVPSDTLRHIIFRLVRPVRSAEMGSRFGWLHSYRSNQS